MITACGYCGGEPLTAGFNHRLWCPIMMSNNAGTAMLTNTQLVPEPPLSQEARRLVSRLARKLRCIISDYEMLGALDHESLVAARSLLEEAAIWLGERAAPERSTPDA